MKYQDPGSMPGCTAAVLRWYAIGVGTQGIAFALGSRMPALGGLALTPLGAFVSMLADILSNVSGHAGSTRSSGQYMDLDPLGWAVFDLIKRRARAALAQAMIVHDFSTRCRRRRRSRGMWCIGPARAPHAFASRVRRSLPCKYRNCHSPSAAIDGTASLAWQIAARLTSPDVFIL